MRIGSKNLHKYVPHMDNKQKTIQHQSNYHQIKLTACSHIFKLKGR